MIAIVGDEGVDPTGMMYETQLKARGHEVQWISFEELSQTIVANVGETLHDWLQHDPFLTGISEKAFTLNSNSLLRRARGAILVDAGTQASNCTYLLSILLRDAGIAQPNHYRGVQLASDKWATHKKLVQAKLPRPKAELIRSAKGALRAAARLQYPVVIKERCSSQGKGVFRARGDDELLECVAALEIGTHALVIEQYVECSSADKRVVVVDGVVMGGMERIARDGDFRANLALGGSVGRVGVDDDEAELSLRAAEVLGMSFVGMDFGRVDEVLPGREALPVGSLFCMEANDCAGLSGFKMATGVDASGPVIDMMLRLADEKEARSTV